MRKIFIITNKWENDTNYMFVTLRLTNHVQPTFSPTEKYSFKYNVDLLNLPCKNCVKFPSSRSFIIFSKNVYHVETPT